MNQLVTPHSDRAQVALKLKSLIHEGDTLNSHPHRSLLDSLEAALAPSNSAPGSVDASIDDLLEVCQVSSRGRIKTPDPRFLKVLTLGFDAVPILINHLEDRRLTRSQKEGFGNFPSYPQRLCELVSELLQGIAGEDLGKDWLNRQQGYPVERRDAQVWWEKASKKSEEQYLAERILTPNPRDGSLNSSVLLILEKKFPNRLADSYQKVLGVVPPMSGRALAEAVGRSGLSQAGQIELFRGAAGHKLLRHRIDALEQLSRLDHPLYVNLLVENLEGLSGSTAGPYWGSPEAALATLVIETADSRAWEALRTATKRSEVGLRMEFMSPMNYGRFEGIQQAQRIQFLTEFLEDDEVRVAAGGDKRWEGPHAASSFPRISVQNVAAIQLASILKIPSAPEGSWTPEQWATYRAQVKTALKK